MLEGAVIVDRRVWHLTIPSVWQDIRRCGGFAEGQNQMDAFTNRHL